MKPSNCDTDLSSLDDGENDGLTRLITPTSFHHHVVHRDDKRVVRMAVMDRAAASRNITLHIRSITHHSVSARTI
ncbi:hypothetical protein TNCV_3752591 [Trichonephila clavipes]|nr:hypothetical protein TNCV_3752591 [Trichonephila clavipes]